MSRIHPIEPAAIGAELLHRLERGQRTYHDRLQLGGTVAVGAHRSRLQGVDLVVGLIGHRHALLKHQQAKHEADRQEHVDYHAPHIDEEIAERLLAPEGADYRGQAAKSDRRREKEVGYTKEDLAEV